MLYKCPIPMWCLAVLIGQLGMQFGPQLQAQGVPAEVLPTHAAAHPSAPLQAPSDTSRYMRLGVSPFLGDVGAAGYVSPSMCVAAAEREQVRALRTSAIQENSFVDRPDTLSLAPATVQAAAACSVRWPVATTDTFALPGLLRAALFANHDEVAAAAAARWRVVLSPRDTTALAERRLQLMRLYLMTYPLSPSRVRAALAEHTALQTMGTGALDARVNAQLDDALYARLIGQLRWMIASEDTLNQLLRQQTQSLGHPGVYANMELLRHENSLLGFFLEPEGRLNTPAVRALWEAGNARIPPSEGGGVWANFDEFLKTNNVEPHGPPLQAQYWFNRPDSMGLLPRPGVPTVILRVDPQSAQREADFRHRAYAEYRRLYAALAPRGVQFIVLVRTNGSFINSLLLPEAAEVDSIRGYVQTQLQLPGILGIERTPYQTLPTGRQVPMPTANDWWDQHGVETSHLVFVTASGTVVNSFTLVWNADLGTPLSPDAISETFITNQMHQ